MSLNTKEMLIFIDNDDDEIKIFERVCEKAKLPLTIKTFKSGTVFLKYMESLMNRNQALPKHVLVDINMPGVDGFEVVEEIKAFGKWTDQVQLTFFTNSTWEKDKKIAQDLKANFMTKPDNIEDYISFLKSIA